MLEIETIAVLGTEREAVKVALLGALAGMHVRLWDEQTDALDAAFHALREDVERAVADGHLDRDQRQRAFDGILFTPDLEEAVLGADLAYDATAREAGAARALLATLGRSCRATALLAMRGDPEGLAGAVPQPGRVLGLDAEPGDGPFPTLRLRPGAATTPHARERGEEFVARLSRAAGGHR